MATRITAAYRWPDDVKERIQGRAQEFGLTETEYVKRAALGELEVQPADVRRELDEILARLARLETLAYNG